MAGDFDTAKRMLDAGAGWIATQRATGISVDRLKRRFVPGWGERRAESVRVRRAQVGRAGDGVARRVWSHGLPFDHVDQVAAARALASIPPDTRTLTGRVFGDPLPTRSALDRRPQ